MKNLQREIAKKTVPSNARERIGKLLDKGSFVETNMFAKSRIFKEKDLLNDGVITGFGTIDSRKVFVYSQDFSQMGGTLGEMHAKKICAIYDLAMKTGCPVIGILDSGGARIQEGVFALNGYAEIFKRNVEASGKILQISIIAGVTAGGASYSPALTDFVFMIKNQSTMFVTGPKVIKAVTGEEVSIETLGGAMTHNEKSGVAHFAVGNEDGCFSLVRQLLTYLPSNYLDNPPEFESNDDYRRSVPDLEKIVPDDSTKTYDMKQVIDLIFDKNSFFGLQRFYAKNAIIGFARLEGVPVGVVANQPKVKAGCLDINSSTKIARFVRFCDAFSLPIINLVDVPGYLPGVDQESGGIIRHGAKVLFAYADATVPKIAVVLRKAYGGALIAMCSKAFYDFVIAWPNAEMAVMGSRQALEITHAKKISSMTDAEISEEMEKYKQDFLDIYKNAENGDVDLLIEKKNTREAICLALRALRTKVAKKSEKKISNIPL